MVKVIAVRNLKKTFGKNTIAVDDISFEVQENQIFGLIGPNGSGKTTTLRILTMILRPTSGEIKYYNKNLANTSINQIREIIGYVPQGNCLYGDLTVLENLYTFALLFNVEDAKARALEVLSLHLLGHLIQALLAQFLLLVSF